MYEWFPLDLRTKPPFSGDPQRWGMWLHSLCGAGGQGSPMARNGFWGKADGILGFAKFLEKKTLSPSNFNVFFVFFPVPESFHGYMTGIKYLSPIGWELPWPAISCYQPKVLGNSYTLKADLWSLGVISYMLLTGSGASEKRFGWLKYGEKIWNKWLTSARRTLKELL